MIEVKLGRARSFRNVDSPISESVANTLDTIMSAVRETKGTRPSVSPLIRFTLLDSARRKCELIGHLGIDIVDELLTRLLK